MYAWRMFVHTVFRGACPDMHIFTSAFACLIKQVGTCRCQGANEHLLRVLLNACLYRVHKCLSLQKIQENIQF